MSNDIVPKQETRIQQHKIGNLTLNYSDDDKPIHATPIVQDNGEIVILTNIRASGGRSRVILQDLAGNEMKNLMNLGFENAEFAVDDTNIYIFTSNADSPQLKIFNKKSYKPIKSKSLGDSRIQSVCCDGSNLYTFDMRNGEIQTRDKEGNIVQVESNVKKDYIYSHQFMFVTSTGLHWAGIDELGITKEYKKELEEKFGKEFMDLNDEYDSLAYDEKTQTTYLGSRNLVFVANPNGIQGVMYFQDKRILGLDIDTVTDSLMISASNSPESEKSKTSDKGGSLEIIPTDMVNTKIKDSMEYLSKRHNSEKLKNIGHDIVDLSNGNFEVMIYLMELAKEKGENILPIIDFLTSQRVKTDEIISTTEAYIQQSESTQQQSLLQQKEKELYALEAKAQTIAETEALIEKQQEDQRTGE